MLTVSGIVLAGGQSSRLGMDKSFVNVNGQSLIKQIVAKLARLSDDVIIVANSPEKYHHLEARLVGDIYPGKGALGGIYSGLKSAANTHSLVVACDMPFLDLNLLRYMILLARGHDVVIPRVGGFPEPLHAIYSKSCLEPIDRLLARGGLKIIDFFPEVRVRYVEEGEVDIFDPQHLSFFNVNVPGDVEEMKELVRRDKGN
ncbi:MAG: molybdenum cofactor guanylyltransferase [Anaerolineae bacterium]